MFHLTSMLQFTKETDYGIQLLLALAKLKDRQVLSLRKFSAANNISFLFLQKVVRKLREAGLVESSKGAQGGYSLKKSLNKISLKEAVEAIDGECAVSNCLRPEPDCRCVKENNCGVKNIFCKVNKQLVSYLQSIKLSDCI